MATRHAPGRPKSEELRLDPRVGNVTEYVSFTNRYNGKNGITGFGSIGVSDLKDPASATWGQEGTSATRNIFKLDKSRGSFCPSEALACRSGRREGYVGYGSLATMGLQCTSGAS